MIGRLITRLIPVGIIREPMDKGADMNAFLSVAISALLFVPLLGRTCFAQSPPHKDKCTTPIVLEVIPSSTGPEYRLSGKAFKLYPLTEMSNELHTCKAERAVYIMLDYHVSLGDFLGSMPPKLQAESVCYFIRTQSSLVEISIVSYDAKVPESQ